MLNVNGGEKLERGQGDLMQLCCGMWILTSKRGKQHGLKGKMTMSNSGGKNTSIIILLDWI